MKKTVTKSILAGLLLTGSMLSASSQHDQGMSNMYIGASKASYKYGSDGNTRVALGIDYMPFHIVSGLYVGAGFDFVGIDGYSANELFGNYTLGAQLKIGYSLESLINWRVNLKAGYGYGVTRYASTNNGGSQYEMGIDSKLYKTLGVGYKYKHVDMGIGNASYDANIVYAELMF